MPEKTLQPSHASVNTDAADYVVSICHLCLAGKGDSCNTPECVFCRIGMDTPLGEVLPQIRELIAPAPRDCQHCGGMGSLVSLGGPACPSCHGKKTGLADRCESANCRAIDDRRQLLALVGRMRPYMGHRLATLPGKPRCDLMVNWAIGEPDVHCTCGLAALLRETEVRK